MFRVPDAGAEVAFGDVFEVGWVGDVYVGSSSERLMRQTLRGGAVGFVPAQPDQRSERWVVSAGQASRLSAPIRCMVTNDDCHIEGVIQGRADSETGRRLSAGGRLLLAPIRPASPDEVAQTGSFKRLPVVGEGSGLVVPPSFGHGGLIDFDQTFNLKLGRDDVAAFVAGRIASPTADGRRVLERKWAAFSARRGPMVSELASAQLYRLVHGRDGELPGLFELLASTWELEGRVAEEIASAEERRRAGASVDPVPLLAGLSRAYDAMRSKLEAAQAELDGLRPS